MFLMYGGNGVGFVELWARSETGWETADSKGL